ncbi:MAG: tRNA (adenosine(37)-N6)-threonylcarbamoyltransferase complex dimerization subunit type 1 TsaB [Christensenellaceae bacterium]|nr:tRNA (adenosine(37)-N6)-threonylcarbamoyltransferase complex dimerization subunit type 1 TsaB [Christensenellaceae bacterium]
MNLLLIDSTKTELTVAVATDGEIIATQICTEQRKHDKNINRLVKVCLANAKLDFADLSAVAVVVGDGSWTGIRVGLAVAKAYSYVLSVPIVELTGGIDLAAAIKKYNTGDTVNAFTVKPFYNGEFVVNKAKK